MADIPFYAVIILTVYVAIATVDMISFNLVAFSPICGGFVTGLVLGDATTGLVLGATLQLMSLGVASYGGASVPDYLSASIMGTAYAIISGQGVEYGIGLAIPISLLLTQLDILTRMVNTALQHRADRFADEGNPNGVERCNLMGICSWTLSRMIPVFLGLFFGAPLVSLINEYIPAFVIDGLRTVGSILPAMGIAILLRYLPLKRFFPYTILGFVLMAYFGGILNMVGVALIGFVLACLYYFGQRGKAAAGEEAAPEEATAATTAEFGGKITKKELNAVFRRMQGPFQWAWNYEKMQALGYCYSIMPVLKKLYGHSPELLKRAMKLHLEFFNTTPAMAHLIVGADIALEEQYGLENEEAIVSLKTSLMGPFAGVGDTLFSAIYRMVVLSIVSYIALEGHAIGLFIPVAAGLAVIWLRYKFTYIGYRQGKSLATGLGAQMSGLTDAASVLGLTVVGALIPSVVSYQVDLTFAMGEVSLSVQDMMNLIMPGLAPLLIVLLSYWLLGKKWMNSTKLIWVLIALGMALGILQSFAR